MTLHRTKLTAVVLSLFVAIAWAQTASSDKPLVTDGRGNSISATDILVAAERVPEASRSTFLSRVDNVSRQAEELFLRRGLAAEAERAGLDKNPLVAAQLQQARDRILSDARVAEIDKAASISDEAARAYAREVYRATPQRFAAAAQTRAKHILIRPTPDGKGRELAKDLLAQLRSGASFDDLARRHSADSANAAKGGDLGYFADNTMVKPFEDAVAALTQPGAISDVVDTEFGYHIIKLEGRRPAGTLPFEEVREGLEREARTKVQNEARQANIAVLQRTAKVDSAAMEAFAKQYESPAR